MEIDSTCSWPTPGGARDMNLPIATCGWRREKMPQLVSRVRAQAPASGPFFLRAALVLVVVVPDATAVFPLLANAAANVSCRYMCCPCLLFSAAPAVFDYPCLPLPAWRSPSGCPSPWGWALLRPERRWATRSCPTSPDLRRRSCACRLGGARCGS